MGFKLLAIAASIVLIIHGYISLRSGLRKEDKVFWVHLPVAGIFKTPNYIRNIIWGALEIFMGFGGLYLYVPDFF